jgi:hypothetical protein
MSAASKACQQLVKHGGGAAERGGCGIQGWLKGDRYDDDASPNIPKILKQSMPAFVISL